MEIAAPLLEISMDRAVAIVDLRGISRPLNLHLICMFGYPADSETRKHWRNEILNWLDDVASITIKPRKHRMSEKDYYKFLFDERFGPDIVQNVTAMHRRIAREKPDLNKSTVSDQEIWGKMAAFHRAFAKRVSQAQAYDDLVPT